MFKSASLKKLKLVVLIVGIFLIGGCGKIMNPYSSKFSCPEWEQGKCIGIPEAYYSSFEKEGNYTINQKELEEQYRKLLSSEEFDESLSYVRKQYLEGLYNTMKKLFEEPVMPVLVPPKIVRVLVLPYGGEKESKFFYGNRYIYVVVEDYKWLLQNLYDLHLKKANE